MSESLPLTQGISASSGSTNVDVPAVPGQTAYEVVVGGAPQIEVATTLTNTIVTLGNTSTPNEIHLNGGVRYNVLILDDSKTSYTISDNDFIIIVDSPTYTSIKVPSASGRAGKAYQIVRRFGGPTILSVSSVVSDTFDGDTDIDLIGEGNTQIVCTGTSNWMIV